MRRPEKLPTLTRIVSLAAQGPDGQGAMRRLTRPQRLRLLVPGPGGADHAGQVGVSRHEIQHFSRGRHVSRYSPRLLWRGQSVGHVVTRHFSAIERPLAAEEKI